MYKRILAMEWMALEILDVGCGTLEVWD